MAERNSVISGIERLAENGQEGEDPGTFQAMLDFVNRQIVAETGTSQPVNDMDENWLNVDDFSDSNFLVMSSHSSVGSTDPTGSFSPPTPLKTANSSPSRSVPQSPKSPRRRSGIPLRKTSSPTRRALFSKGGGSSQTAAGKKNKGRKGQQSKSPSLSGQYSSSFTPNHWIHLLMGFCNDHLFIWSKNVKALRKRGSKHQRKKTVTIYTTKFLRWLFLYNE